MQFLIVCVLFLGVTGLSQASSEESADYENVLEESYEDFLASSVEDFQDAEEDFEEPTDDYLQEYSTEDFQDAEEDFEEPSDDYLQEYSTEDFQEPSETEDSEDLDAFRESMREAFSSWNAAVKDCEGSETCLAQVNNVIRPVVNEAADKGVLSVIEPCEDRVGTYELETVDGWTIEAVLPC